MTNKTEDVCKGDLSIGSGCKRCARCAQQLENRIAQLDVELIKQTNRAASAEQQLTAMTQRWEMANAMGIEARAQFAQRQVPADGWKTVLVDPSYDMRVQAILAFNTCKGDRDDALQAAFQAMLAASPTPPQRERDHALLAMCKLLEPHLFQHDKLEPMHCDGPNTSKRVHDAIALSNNLYEAARGIKGADQ